MKLLEFEKIYPDEGSCIAKIKEVKDKGPWTCPICGCKARYWKSDKLCYECKDCHHRESIRKGTVMENSKLPFRYWFTAMHLLTSTKHTFSALELQKQLGHKRYQPIWEMLHKLRDVMGKRDGKYTLMGNVEIDEGFFSTEIPDGKKGEKLKAGAGSQAKTKVLVMAESVEEKEPKNPKKPKKVGHIKMIVIPNLKSQTIDPPASKSIDKESKVTGDATTSHVHFPKLFNEYVGRVVNPEDIGKILPWVHLAISNAKSLLTDIYHGIKPEFLQEYLNEFCYKFNRRYFGEHQFDRLLIAGASYSPDFEHRLYNKHIIKS
jgi:hypothetical protein